MLGKMSYGEGMFISLDLPGVILVTSITYKKDISFSRNKTPV